MRSGTFLNDPESQQLCLQVDSFNSSVEGEQGWNLPHKVGEEMLLRPIGTRQFYKDCRQTRDQRPSGEIVP